VRAARSPIGVRGTKRAPVPPAKIACIIRYQIDPFQLEAFRKYAENWGDPEARANFAMAQSMRLILREERNFVEMVE